MNLQNNTVNGGASAGNEPLNPDVYEIVGTHIGPTPERYF